MGLFLSLPEWFLIYCYFDSDTIAKFLNHHDLPQAPLYDKNSSGKLMKILLILSEKFILMR
jgi:hypothetical protein